MAARKSIKNNETKHMWKPYFLFQRMLYMAMFFLVLSLIFYFFIKKKIRASLVSVVKHSPANAGDTGLIFDPEGATCRRASKPSTTTTEPRSHNHRSPHTLELVLQTREAPMLSSQGTTAAPRSPLLEKSPCRSKDPAQLKISK